MAIALGCGAAAGGARAQALTSAAARDALNDAAFARKTFEVALPAKARHGAAVNSVRINLGQPTAAPGGAFEQKDVDVTLVRSWPKAAHFSSPALDVDIAPHAGVGVSRRGGQAEGGATLTVSPKSREERAKAALSDMGVGDGARFGDQGRWYLFAAASGRAVGLNMLHGDQGWDRAGWTTDPTGGLVGDAQVGVGWRKGAAQSSFGVIHREVRGNHMIFGQGTRDDTVAAFTFSYRPGK
jgi:hypothetical protein